MQKKNKMEYLPRLNKVRTLKRSAFFPHFSFTRPGEKKLESLVV
ncbi:MAG: hypothetical protein ACTSVI_10150 [Promethearchaeota archaeon]